MRLRHQEDLTSEEIEQLKKLSKKYKRLYEDVLFDYCFRFNDMKEMKKEYVARNFYESIGVDLDNQRKIESDIRKINLYTKTINVLIKIGWCYNDDIVTTVHNDRAALIHEVEKLSKGKLITRPTRNGKGNYKVYNREEYLKKLEV